MGESLDMGESISRFQNLWVPLEFNEHFQSLKSQEKLTLENYYLHWDLQNQKGTLKVPHHIAFRAGTGDFLHLENDFLKLPLRVVVNSARIKRENTSMALPCH